MVGQNNDSLPIVVTGAHCIVELKPTEVQNNTDLPIVVEPIEAQNNIDFAHCGRAH